MILKAILTGLALSIGATASVFVPARPFRPWMAAVVCAAVAAGALLPAIWSDAHAASVQIVALGPSNTRGYGVSPSEAWPARLQAMLKAKGIDARVINAGVDGDTTGGMLARLDSAVPSGTQIVVLQPGGNDQRSGRLAERAGNIAQIKGRLAARKIKVVILENHLLLAVPPSELQPDKLQFTPPGHSRVARSILPQVLAAVGK